MVEKSSTSQVGLREQKAASTRSRIAYEGLRLFDRRGYDATTLEEIAIAAGVSPRTLYHYFRTKHDLLLFFHDEGLVAEIGPTVLSLPGHLRPLEVARDCLLTLVPKYETANMATTYRIWNSTTALKAQKLLAFKDIELTLFDALRQRWPDAENRATLKAACLVAVGCLGLAMDAGQIEGDTRSLRQRLEESFQTITELLP